MKPSVLMDIGGVFHVDGVAIEGGAETVEWLREQDLKYRFVTNITLQSRESVRRSLEQLGLEVDAGQIHTPLAAASRWIAEHRAEPVAAFVAGPVRSDLEPLRCIDIDDPEGSEVGAVVIGDLGVEWTFQRLNRAFRLLMANPQAQLIALGGTRYWKAADGLRLDVAPITAALTCGSGREAMVIGKPAREFFLQAAAAMEADPGSTVMIGDDIRSDVAGAQGAGMRGVLVRTGKFSPSDLAGDIRPNAVIDSIANLPQWLSDQYGAPAGAQ